MKVVAYLRVSTEDQASKGVSIHAQRAKVREYAKLYEHELVAVVEDAGLSAKTLDRPGLKRALALLDTGEAQALLVMKLDRLTRSVRDLGDLLEKHFKPGKGILLSLSEQIDTGSAAGRLLLHVLGALSEWERSTIAERTTAALAHKKARGERTGSIPYGYAVGEDGKALQPVEAEQVTIAKARELRGAGLSLRCVATELAAAGHATRTGRTFDPQQVRRMLAA